MKSLLRALSIVQALGSVCDLTAVTRFFNGNPVLGSLGGGVEAFAGRPGRKRWAEIEAAIARSWDGVIDAIDEVITTPDVDSAAVKRAEDELAGPAPEPEEDELDDAPVIDDVVDTDEEVDALADARRGPGAGQRRGLLDPVGIDPIRIMSRGGTYFTLRCYVDDEPMFLGRNGRISVFGSERSLARYLADEHENDLSGFDTYDDIRTAATDGSLEIEVTDENVYVLSGLADDIADGPEAVDRDQLDLAVELLRDVADYAEDPAVDTALDADQPLGRFVAHVLDAGHRQQAPRAVRQGRGAVGGTGDLRRVAAAPRVTRDFGALAFAERPASQPIRTAYRGLMTSSISARRSSNGMNADFIALIVNRCRSVQP